MTEPAKLPDNVPTIRLAGKDWPIPELAIFQLRRTRSRIILVNEALYPRGIPDASPEERAAGASGNFVGLNDEQYEALLDAMYYALLGAHPEMKRDEFERMHISDTELFASFFVVRQQSGIYVLAKKAAEANDPTGEAAAETASRTGTE